MRIFSKNLRLQDITIMYFTALAALMVILVASYQAPNNAVEVSSLKPNPSRPLPPLPMPFRVPLDPRGELQLAWNVSYTNQEIYMELRVAELRHGVVLGMSDRGELTNADLLVLWDSGTQSYFGDAWSDSKGHVSLDSQQDYDLIEAKQKAEGYYLLFKRPFSTCDPRDYVIEEGTVHIIYGFLVKPLASLDKLNLSEIRTGVQRVLMLRPDTPPPTLPPDVQMLDVVAPNVIIPNQETTYWCYIHNLPENLTKNHIVMYESAITPGNEAIVHHIEVFECSPDVPAVPGYSGSCDDKMKPKKLNFCRHVLAAWAMGAEEHQWEAPPKVAENNRAKVLWDSDFQTDKQLLANQPDIVVIVKDCTCGSPGAQPHQKEELHAGRRDSSGIRLYYTPSLRRYDAGIMELGLVYTPVMGIPPKQHTFYLSGYCTSKCTQTALPSGGIYVFASQLHTHLAGRGVRTILVRGGKELEVVQEDQHFSTHYQTIRVLRKMVNILPGDVLITKCTYNTEDRSKPTVGGFGIMEEMCVNYIHYYPRTQLELCKSHVDQGYLQKYFNFINRFHGNDQCVCGEVSVTEQFSQLEWDEFTGEVLDSLYNTAPISMHCNQSTARLFPGDWDKQPIPAVTSVLEKPQYTCKRGTLRTN
ncbi:dopamine beta-hydroxylase [Pundamilia nyererei]|uniref:Dopamine beta-hydroxylase n=1 Tax=Pundamilia nyererei TaxID=303518 RepID=A0A9Y3R0P6_9CICH|nr:PREDICTED: dopamine beta-hydroxylase [Pundamilia nyererei]